MTALAAAVMLVPVASAPAAERRYELVSPPAKNTSDVAQTASRLRSSPSGDQLTYVSSGAFADPQGTGATVQYLADRGGSGWTSDAITPPQQSNAGTLLTASMYRDFSEDLATGVFRQPPPSPAAGAPVATNLMLRDNVNGTYSAVTTVAPADGSPGYLFPDLYQPFYVGASDDFSHVAFESSGALTSNAPDDGTTKLYESINGRLRLVGILPDDSPAAGGSVGGPGAGGGFQPSNRFTRSAVSADGSRIFFTAAPDWTGAGQIYVRENGERTIHVTASQRTPPDPSGPWPATFRGASEDGGKVLFTTFEQMVDADTNFVDDLYQFDVDTGELTRLSVDREPGDGVDDYALEGVIGQGADGSDVYFAANRQLVAGGPTDPQVYVYHWDGSVLRYIAAANFQDTSTGDLWSNQYQTGKTSRVTPDGSHLMFMTFAQQTAFENVSGERQAYLYAEGRGLRCVSCRPGTNRAEGRANISQYSTGVAAAYIEYQPRALSDDGSRVYFATSAPLVDADTNGRYDVYEYNSLNGAVDLISTGVSGDDSWFADASEDGRDVFFVTRQRLSGWDRDDNADVYDARIGGGFNEPPPPQAECVGDPCQGPLQPQPNVEVPPSVMFVGPGDIDDPEPPRVPGPVRLGRTSVRGTRITARIAVPSRGRLTVSGGRINGLRRTLPRGGTYSVRTSLTRKARRLLRRDGRVRVRIRIAFTPTGGTASVATKTLTVRG